MTYEIELNFYYQTFDPFKQKASLILQSLFANGRMIDYARFNGYGLINIESRKADKIIIEETDKFNRAKTNCIIYDLTYNKWNPGKYNKLFIYRTNMSRDNAFYGYILYNTETGKMINIYNIDYADDKLYQYIYRSIINLSKDKLWDHYSKQYDAVHGRYGLTLEDCPTYKDWKEMKEYYDAFIRLPVNGKLNLEE